MPGTAAKVALGAAMGALAGCVPAAAFVVGCILFPRPAPMGIGIAVLVYLTVFAAVGMVAGVVGGIMRDANRRFLTAASPCLGIVGGATVAAFFYAIAEGLMYLTWLAPAAGGALGILYALWAGRRSTGTT